MGADHSFYVKTIETHARAFLPLNISAISSVIGEEASSMRINEDQWGGITNEKTPMQCIDKEASYTENVYTQITD